MHKDQIKDYVQISIQKIALKTGLQIHDRIKWNINFEKRFKK